MSDEPKYSITIYKDHALIRGWIGVEVLELINLLCKIEGFTHLTAPDEGFGFKVVRKGDN